MRLLKHGFGTKKGSFGFVRIGTQSKTRKFRKVSDVESKAEQWGAVQSREAFFAIPTTASRRMANQLS